jgi:alpha-mannosidase
MHKTKHIGRHHFRYAIYPHRGPLDIRTVQTAFNFNNPMRVYAYGGGEPAPVMRAFSAMNHDSLVLDTVKRGEDDEDVACDGGSDGSVVLRKRPGRSVIMRIYDSLGGRSRGVIETSLPVRKVWKCNVLEDDLEPVAFDKGQIPVELRAFEVATYRLQL